MLFGTPKSEPGSVTIYTDALDDSTEFKPDVAILTAQRPSWEKCLQQRSLSIQCIPMDSTITGISCFRDN